MLAEFKINSKEIDKNGKMLAWEEIREMKDMGVSFGSHGMTHSILTKIPKEELSYEIEASKLLIKKRTGISVKFFAYPNGQAGDFDKNTVQALKETNYEAGFSLLKSSNNKTSDMFALKRLCISNNSSDSLFNNFSPSLFDIEILGLFRLLKTSLKWRSR